jgi:hypothetical protein
MAKLKGETIQRTNKKERQYNGQVKRIWPLYCLSFLFGHCIVSPFYLAIVLSLLFIWPLYCLSFLFGHCIVNNGQIKRRDNTMAK